MRRRAARSRARQDTRFSHERWILRSFQDLLVDEAMFVPRARTYLAATAVRGFGWCTTYDLLSLSPPRERNMFTSSNSNSLLTSSRGLSASLGDRAPRRVASRGVASPLPAATGRTWKKEKTRRGRESAENDRLSHSGNCQCHLLLAAVPYLISRTCQCLSVSFSRAPSVRPTLGPCAHTVAR